MRNRGELRRQGVGYAAEGVGFYVWDEDPRRLRPWATALRDAARASAVPNADPDAAAPEAAGARIDETAADRLEALALLLQLGPSMPAGRRLR